MSLLQLSFVRACFPLHICVVTLKKGAAATPDEVDTLHQRCKNIVDEAVAEQTRKFTAAFDQAHEPDNRAAVIALLEVLRDKNEVMLSSLPQVGTTFSAGSVWAPFIRCVSISCQYVCPASPITCASALLTFRVHVHFDIEKLLFVLGLLARHDVVRVVLVPGDPRKWLIKSPIMASALPLALKSIQLDNRSVRCTSSTIPCLQLVLTDTAHFFLSGPRPNLPSKREGCSYHILLPSSTATTDAHAGITRCHVFRKWFKVIVNPEMCVSLFSICSRPRTPTFHNTFFFVRRSHIMCSLVTTAKPQPILTDGSKHIA